MAGMDILLVGKPGAPHPEECLTTWGERKRHRLADFPQRFGLGPSLQGFCQPALTLPQPERLLGSGWDGQWEARFDFSSRGKNGRGVGKGGWIHWLV